ncbi:MAG: glycosyltransferase [Alphaproteobacteria bacterium]|nr:MAG: glycosyltransferase [Alphaproteobacteria bacterium]
MARAGPELVVTNLNPRFTGVSATAANVVRRQAALRPLVLAGYPLPGGPEPVSVRAARQACRVPPEGRPFAIWHVRRNPEMRAAIWARDVLRLPIRIVFTSAARRRHSAYPRWLISRMDAVIATTEDAARYVPHVRAVVPHGVDTERFSPPSDREGAWRALGLPGRAGIATIGRIRPEKGTDRFVEAMIETLPRLPGFTAVVAGRAGPEHAAFERRLRQRVAEAGLADRIVFTGEIPAERMPDFMKGLSLLVALPRYEGYGMTPLEAMASGVPFIGSDTGNFAAFASAGGGEVLSESALDRVPSLVAGLLGDPARLHAASERARAAAVERFSVVREVEGIEAVYRELWDRGRPA